MRFLSLLSSSVRHMPPTSRRQEAVTVNGTGCSARRVSAVTRKWRRSTDEIRQRPPPVRCGGCCFCAAAAASPTGGRRLGRPGAAGGRSLEAGARRLRPPRRCGRRLGHRFAAAWVRVRATLGDLGTGSCVSVRQTTTLVVRGLGRAFLCLSICLCV